MENQPPVESKPKKNYVKRGVYWIVAPFALLVFVFVAYVVLSPAMMGSSALVAVNYVLGLLGLISLIGIPVGVVVGIVYIVKGSKQGD